MQLDIQLGQLRRVPLQGAEVIALVGNVAGGAGVGADVLHREHFQLLDRAAVFLGDGRHMATGAIFREQCAALGGEGLVDGAEQVFRPGRRFEPLQGFFDQVEVAYAHARWVARVTLERLAGAVEEGQGGAYTEGFADIARHRLLGRAVPLHPVEGPDIPQVRVVHWRIGDAIVVRRNRVAEAGIGDAAERVGTARAFFGGVEAAVGVVPGNFQELVQRLLEVLAQLAVLGIVLIAEHLAREALELPRVVIRCREAGDEGLAETAAAQRGHTGRQHMLGRAAIDAQGLALEAQLAGVAGGAGDVQVFNAAAGVGVPGKPHRQVAGVLRGGHLFGIDQEAEARQVLRRGEALFGKRQFQGSEPVVMQALDLGALGREVVGLAVGGTPLILVVHLLHGHVFRQPGVEGVIDHHGQGEPQHDEYQQ